MWFKDLKVLSVILLAKQCWRMLMNQKAWWVRIMKGNYFPKCSILEGKKGARASQSQASIHEGKEFLKDKVLWQVMSGEDVDIGGIYGYKELDWYALGMKRRYCQRKQLASLIETGMFGNLKILMSISLGASSCYLCYTYLQKWR